ncbi:hypothetical protein R3X27_25250 [Tropicimonas sp. TH_r6]|uniref:hypothetical protein n=1 Tax=Tropicimonas sp. TH_r6 TaxID=3082085 RepID=UPI002954103F|nr:hypothetical protein [Tropicimonas sp. TH_r6]MDV7145990.1 hypothetical protein [Tropicimonas sp. TH_r6]
MPNATSYHGKGAKRDQKGRFLPGTKPPRSPGRPPGPNGVKARAARLASDRLEEMLGQAADVIEMALDEGDVRAATWLIDRVRPPTRSDFVQLSFGNDLGTPGKLVEAARAATEAAGKGEVAMSEARAYVDLLTRYGAIQGYLEVERLRAQLDELKTVNRSPQRTMDLSRVPETYQPTWGRGVSAETNSNS